MTNYIIEKERKNPLIPEEYFKVLDTSEDLQKFKDKAEKIRIKVNGEFATVADIINSQIEKERQQKQNKDRDKGDEICLSR